MPTTPNRSTSEAQLNQWNQQLRASPLWQNWMRSMGKDRPGAGLNERERGEFERYLAQNGVKIPGGMHIDQGGNLNQDNRLWRNVGIGAAIGGGALTGFGLAGMGPLAGALGGGAAAGGAMPAAMGFETAGLAGPGAAGMLGGASAGGLLAGGSIPAAMGSIGGPAAIASQGVSRGIPWGGAADAADDYLGGRRRGRGVGRAIGDAADTANRLSPLLQAAIAGLSGLPALLAKNGPSDEEKALLDEARQMQALQRQRIQSQDPLFQAVTKLAMSRLPGSVQG
jgi:hypothetical protein